MMQGQSYTEESLLKAIVERFGPDERFYTCSAEDMTAQELIDFLKARGKFKPMEEGFAVDSTKVCHNE